MSGGTIELATVRGRPGYLVAETADGFCWALSRRDAWRFVLEVGDVVKVFRMGRRLDVVGRRDEETR